MVQDWLTGQAVDDAELLVATVPEDDQGNLTVRGPGAAVPAGSDYTATLT
ncbi:hypothetical protein [Streptomyces sp. 8N616]